MDEIFENQLIVTGNATANFIFETAWLSEEKITRVFPRWKDRRSYCLVEDRIIQKYLEASDYSVEVLFLPFRLDLGWIREAKTAEGKALWEHSESSKDLTKSHMRIGKETVGRTVVFIPKRPKKATLGETDSERLVDLIRNRLLFWLGVLGPGLCGHAIIDVEYINVSVEFTKETIARLESDTLTIRQLSQYFWLWGSKDLKGTVHNWLQGIPYKDRERKPLFCPEVPAKKGDSSGCRLSNSDVVTIGLLIGLFSHGMKSFDFEGPSQFVALGVAEMEKIWKHYLADAYPGISLGWK